MIEELEKELEKELERNEIGLEELEKDIITFKEKLEKNGGEDWSLYCTEFQNLEIDLEELENYNDYIKSKIALLKEIDILKWDEIIEKEPRLKEKENWNKFFNTDDSGDYIFGIEDFLIIFLIMIDF